MRACESGAQCTVDAGESVPRYQSGGHINATSDAPAPSGDNAAQVAGAALAAWGDVFASLSPVIGSRGVSALYQRSVHLAQRGHPCLKGADEGEPGPGQFEALRGILSSHPDSRAAGDASAALLHTFRELLEGMIGPKLTQQLLEPVAPAAPPHSAAKPPGTDHHER